MPQPSALPENHNYADVSGLIAVWLVVLFSALVIQYALAGPFSSSNMGAAQPYFSGFASLILTFPTSLLIPLVIGAALGAEIGRKSRDIKVARRAGLVNSIYVALVYIVAIIIINEVVGLANLNPLAPSVEWLILYWMLLPIAVLVVSTEVFAVVAHSRKINL
jgi:hypothetical protein